MFIKKDTVVKTEDFKFKTLCINLFVKYYFFVFIL